MGIFSDNPVLERELRSRLRMRRLRGNRPQQVAAALAAATVAWFYVKSLIAINRGQPEDARDLWSYLVIFLLLVIVVIAPALLSTAITLEREQQTWEALTATRLTAAQVILGKWLGRVVLALLPVAVLLPFLIECSTKGALPPTALPATLAFLVVTAAGYSVLGLLCSFLARKTVSATVSALMVTLGLCLGTWLLDALLPNYVRGASQTYTYQDLPILWINPFYALTTLNSTQVLHPSRAFPDTQAPVDLVLVTYFLVTLLAACGGLCYMVARFQRTTRE